MRWISALFLPLGLAAAPAIACTILPPVPGQSQPSEGERLSTELRRFDTVALVEVLRDGTAQDRVPVRIVQTVKGKARAGTELTMGRGQGFDPPPCAGMMVPVGFSFVRGERVVIAFVAGQPEFNRVEQNDLDFMVREHWIRPVRAAP